MTDTWKGCEVGLDVAIKLLSDPGKLKHMVIKEICSKIKSCNKFKVRTLLLIFSHSKYVYWDQWCGIENSAASGYEMYLMWHWIFFFLSLFDQLTLVKIFHWHVSGKFYELNEENILDLIQIPLKYVSRRLAEHFMLTVKIICIFFFLTLT